MRSFTTVAALTSLLSLASARIEGFGVPSTIKAGEEFDAILYGHNYIQTVDEVAAAFGVAPGTGYKGTLGQVIHSEYLGPDKSNEIKNYTIPMTIPEESYDDGAATFTTSLFRLYGAVDAPTVENYSVNITLGEETSEDYISQFTPQSQ